jgi:hypothetical protein
MEELDDQSKRGIMEIDTKTKQVTAFHEKPKPGVTDSLLAGQRVLLTSAVFSVAQGVFGGAHVLLLQQAPALLQLHANAPPTMHLG